MAFCKLQNFKIMDSKSIENEDFEKSEASELTESIAIRNLLEEIKTAPANTIPNSRNKLPTKPGKKITGRKIYSESVSMSNGTNQKHFDLHNFSKGVYIINITADNYSSALKMVVE